MAKDLLACLELADYAFAWRIVDETAIFVNLMTSWSVVTTSSILLREKDADAVCYQFVNQAL